jgi:hypothetical protein
MYRENSSLVPALSFVVAFLVAGCSTPKPLADFRRGSLILPVRLVDSDGQEILVPSPKYGTAHLGSIPGTIFGNPQAPFVWRIDSTRRRFLHKSVKDCT